MSDDAPMVVLGRYAICDVIGSGGMATVHLGRLLGPVGFSRTVAIKRMHAHLASDPEFVTMFLDEARLAAQVQHANVVSTIDVVSEGKELFLVMEYHEGESFARVLRAVQKKGARLPLPVVGAIVSQALYGLHAVHEARSSDGRPLGLVHRDVSPDNILVGRDGQSRILDFGIAKATEHGRRTQAGKIKGKVAYMAPEQLRGEPLDRRVDVYAASAVLWEATVGRRLYPSDNDVENITSILTARPAPPSSVATGLPPGADDLVLKGLSPDRNARFASAKEMAIEVERVFGLASPSAVGALVEGMLGAELARKSKLVDSVARRTAEISSSDLRGARGSVLAAPSSALPNNPSAGPFHANVPAEAASQLSAKGTDILVLPNLELPSPSPRPPEAIEIDAPPRALRKNAVVEKTLPSQGAAAEPSAGPRHVATLAQFSRSETLAGPGPVLDAALGLDLAAPSAPTAPPAPAAPAPAPAPPAPAERREPLTLDSGHLASPQPSPLAGPSSSGQSSSAGPRELALEPREPRVMPRRAPVLAPRLEVDRPAPPADGRSLRPLLLPLLLIVLVLGLGGGYLVVRRTPPPAPSSRPASVGVPDPQACEALRRRVRGGGQALGLSRDGWVAELWLRPREGQTIDAATLDLLALRGPDPASRSEIDSLSARDRPTNEGVIIRLAGPVVSQAFELEGAGRLSKAADRVFEASKAQAGALYLRCAHLPVHDVGLWFRGRDLPTAASSVLFALGAFADVAMIRPDLLYPPGSTPGPSLFEDLDKRTRVGKVGELQAEIERYGGTVEAVDTGGVRITFSIDNGGSGMRTARVVADLAGVESR